MLYDHDADPDENANVAESSEHTTVVEKLRTMLRANELEAQGEPALN